MHNFSPHDKGYVFAFSTGGLIQGAEGAREGVTPHARHRSLESRSLFTLPRPARPGRWFPDSAVRGRATDLSYGLFEGGGG